MKFYDREKEIGVLEAAVKQPKSAMIVVSGRRRVGKSRLVDEFLKKHKGVKALVVPKEEKQVASDFAEAYSSAKRPSPSLMKKGQKPNFDTVKEALEYFFTSSDERILYIDEFPNFLDVKETIPYELQVLWENYKDKTDKILIFSGSYVSMMDKIFTRQKAPLFNRAAFKIILQPLAPAVVWKMQEDIGMRSSVQKITNYCIFGGIPYYYEVLERYGVKNNVQELFFDIGQLREEGQDILRQEFGSAYKKYFSILEAIGSGLVSGGEVAQKLGIAQTTLSKYVQSLQNDFKLIERRVPFDQNPSRSKKGAYAIRDNMLAFWFTSVYGKLQPPNEEELNQFVSRRFENLCSHCLCSRLIKNGERISKSGRWWGSVEIAEGAYEQREIDLIIETDKAVYLGECKWSNHKIGEKELRHLQESAKGLNVKKPIIWALFSKSGFSIGEEKNILLFDADRLTNG